MSRTFKFILEIMNKRKCFAAEYAISRCFLFGRNGDMPVNAYMETKQTGTLSTEKAMLTAVR